MWWVNVDDDESGTAWVEVAASVTKHSSGISAMWFTGFSNSSRLARRRSSVDALKSKSNFQERMAQSYEAVNSIRECGSKMRSFTVLVLTQNLSISFQWLLLLLPLISLLLLVYMCAFVSRLCTSWRHVYVIVLRVHAWMYTMPSSHALAIIDS